MRQTDVVCMQPSEMTTSESNSENKSEMKQEGWRKEKMVPADRPGKDEVRGFSSSLRSIASG